MGRKAGEGRGEEKRALALARDDKRRGVASSPSPSPGVLAPLGVAAGATGVPPIAAFKWPLCQKGAGGAGGFLCSVELFLERGVQAGDALRLGDELCLLRRQAWTKHEWMNEWSNKRKER